MMAWTPGLLVIVGAFGLALLGERSGNVRPYAFSGSSEIIYVLSTLTVIPLAEELVFRMGITPFISRFSGARWGPWYSAIIFSVAHTNPTLARWIGLKIGLPIGPFLLAICCDLIVRRWGRIWPATVFHAACNATVYIFGWINPSWLMKLDGLYM
jgi:membrane protease YdiL (CAAX protease family)